MLKEKPTYSLLKEVGSFPQCGLSSISTGRNSSPLNDLEIRLAEVPV